MPTYNKLVRDKIPEIIEATGKTFTTRILSEQEYLIELKNKSFEELEEYHDAENREEAIEELADLMEVVHAFAKSHDTSLVEIEDIRLKKCIKKGSFDKKVLLIGVED
ncbi:nucleoside triphosphate pyrophosphohydrolase [Rossellomorea vietnamensis]|uniref:Phosphoribosyl-ATP pyrophosphohydrolase n=1 Tax=Rossellomorea vietnamensis TaxID=218284 RepID=A0A0P6VZJ8_9BACI|nr:nucleoside triphosphate pyrophosphohydrolase [Rossellomorea vietnamensis]KPL58399.1 phosphoribosyl-ATP pyrophosphohydrolase [Rossellomorea vietnamensis]